MWRRRFEALCVDMRRFIYTKFNSNYLGSIMKNPTKQELKDRIAELEGVVSNQREELETIERHVSWLVKHNSRATIAAYACLAVIFGIVVYTFGVKPW